MRPNSVEALIEHLTKNYSPTDIIAYDLWSGSDVREVDGGAELTDEEVDNVLYMTERYKDSEYGITWDTISSHIESVLSER
jgi:hypothetical protein